MIQTQGHGHYLVLCDDWEKNKIWPKPNVMGHGHYLVLCDDWEKNKIWSKPKVGVNVITFQSVLIFYPNLEFINLYG